MGGQHEAACGLSKFGGKNAVNCRVGTANLVTIKPYIEQMIDCVGSARIVWGSDWPVVNRALKLGIWIDMSRQLLSVLTLDEQRKIAR
jgi:predicted TIM-barrel fold metal-dependent hydrolase